MNYVRVGFTGTSKDYIYKTRLNLIEGATYKIIADGITSYSNPVKVRKITSSRPNFDGVIREITTAEILTAPPRPKLDVKFIINKEKGTTVAIWKDGTKTIVKCQPGDTFDAEKAIALCFVKRSFNNRGCYNDWIREVMEKNNVSET